MQIGKLKAAAFAAVAVLAGTSAVRADLTGFGNFTQFNSIAPNGLGTAGISGNTLTLTDAVANQATSTFANNAQDIGFTVSFTYTSSGSASSSTTSQFAQGDGFDFVVQNDGRGISAIGGNGGDKGYLNANNVSGAGPITSSAAVAFEMYQSYNDNVLVNDTAVGTAKTFGIPINSSHAINYTLTYSGTTLTESAYDPTFGKTDVQTFTNVNLAGAVGSSALVGFSGGTGGANAKQTITNFSYRTTAGNTYTPIALRASSFNQDGVVEAGAASTINAVTATMDGGTSKSGAAWYEVGANAAAATTGLPASGSVFTSGEGSGHTFQMQSYSGLNVLLLDSANTTGTMTFGADSAESGLSLLLAAGNGPAPITMTVHFGDGAPDQVITGIVSPDWFFQNTGAVTAGGRDNVNGAYETDGANPKLYQIDVPMPDTTDPIHSIDLSYTGTNANSQIMIFGVSGAAVPEPTTLSLLGAGSLALLARRRRV